MRWESLFADLSAQWEAEETAELAAEVADRTRFEAGRLTVVDLLAGAVGTDVTVTVAGAGRLAGRLSELGPDWLLVSAPDAAADRLVALAAVTTVAPAPERPGLPPGGPVAAAWDLRRLLRRMAQRRERLRLTLTDGSVVTGTVDVVGADQLRFAEHPADQPRRAGAVRGTVLVPLRALATVQPVG